MIILYSPIKKKKNFSSCACRSGFWAVGLGRATDAESWSQSETIHQWQCLFNPWMLSGCRKNILTPEHECQFRSLFQFKAHQSTTRCKDQDQDGSWNSKTLEKSTWWTDIYCGKPKNQPAKGAKSKPQIDPNGLLILGLTHLPKKVVSCHVINAQAFGTSLIPWISAAK